MSGAGVASDPRTAHEMQPLSSEAQANLDGLAALARGAFAVVVFSGHRAVLGEIAGETTAHALAKFVMPDPALAERDDFARSAGSTLPMWDRSPLRPIDGVCIVFCRREHAALATLLSAGAQFGRHMVVAAAADMVETERLQRLGRFIAACPVEGDLALLGYGHQGGMLATAMRSLGVEANCVVVFDDHPDSRARAAADGWRVGDGVLSFEHVRGVIASPLSPSAAMAERLARAQQAGVRCFDNAQPISGLKHWQRRGRLLLDEAADRVLAVQRASAIACKDSAIQEFATACIVRQDVRVLAGRRIAHLQGGQRIDVRSDEPFDLAQRWRGDGLAADTFGSFTRAYVALRDRADLGFFAARDFCAELWPDATFSLFPSEHAVDLGRTAFERLLKNHLDVRELVPAMLTPAQRVVLGIAAGHYAANRPIIEIGSALGGSALHMAAATSTHRPAIISIDPDAPTRDIMRFALEREGHGERLRQMVMTSDKAILQLSGMHGECGLVFVDGLHTAEAVARDFHHYASLVAVGGAIAFHDVCPAIHSVMQAVVEHVLTNRDFEARCLVDGLLVLERTRERAVAGCVESMNEGMERSRT